MYKGLKNFFNQTSGFCEQVAECVYHEQYDYLNNKCVQYQHDLNFPIGIGSNFTSSGNGTNVNQTEKIIVVYYFNIA
jgi:hypothetical protein